MFVTGLILNLSVSIIFFLSGILKLYSFKQISESLLDPIIMPKTIEQLIGGTSKKTIILLFSLFEICLSIMLIIYKNKVIINSIAIAVVFLFIFINLKSIKENTSKKCYCFGELGDSRLGYGGLFQSLFLFICLLPAIILDNINFTDLSKFDSRIIIIIMTVSVLIFAILFFIRKLIDQLAERLTI